MKVLWTTNGPVGKAGTILLNRKEEEGGWMSPFLNELQGLSNIEIVVVTAGNNKTVLYHKDKNVSYYILPGGHPTAKYNGRKQKNIKIWKDLIKREKPDVIHIWGCESSIGIAALSACGNSIPSVVYMQGEADSLIRYCEAGIDSKVQKNITTIRDYLRFDTIKSQRKKYGKFLKNQEWLLSHSRNVIVENKWCELHCKKSCEDVVVHYLPLSINKVFFEKEWGNYEKYTIMCPLSYAPLKGIHMLYKALAIVKKQYPNVVLKRLGFPKNIKGIKRKLLLDGYNKYLLQLEKAGNIRENIRYLGVLSSEKVAEEMANSHVFVMCSAIENHSSTLKEAMAVGVPCVTSDVGGVSEYAEHRENVLMYRFEEYELLAQYIIEYFNNEALCTKVSKNSRAVQLEKSAKEKTIYPIIDIYNKVIGAYKKNV